MRELGVIDRQMNALEAQRGMIVMALQWKESDMGEAGSPNQRVSEVASPIKVPLRRPSGIRPSLRSAVLEIMRGDPARHWSKSDLFAELERRSWVPEGRTPKNQLSARLSRLIKDGHVVRLGPAVYALAPYKELESGREHRVRDAAPRR